ncbi:DUF1674-domain-containing protein [Mytilinidion resinicola]|uniref:Succinate dehydrogenase assembly factor 4, mitochondrial n=1 Tax=Mytilinidion resinicola TaxID=574789 RepID=A0A6A6Y734_9PEZI|nr:DUF1674-domain-containing protein [Mytilinidion resinicola]KAF2803617.1 DUF1674-domain-containing protein [Mytilinidion resinicola]
MRPTTTLPRLLSRRAFTTTARTLNSPFRPGPSPPKLPREEQELFEKLQQESSGAFSTPKVNQSPASSTASDMRARINQSPDGAEVEVKLEGKILEEEGEQLHPNIRRGAKPEFEGDVNPKTGEVGGPKNEPLRWGGTGDWSYNGRVTDF